MIKDQSFDKYLPQFNKNLPNMRIKKYFCMAKIFGFSGFCFFNLYLLFQFSC